MKKILFTTALLAFLSVKAQIGVYTSNPQNVFHIDGNKDNSVAGNPTSVQQANDFIVTNTGTVGIGTVVPNSTLQVNGSVSMPITTTGGNLDLSTGDYYTVIYTGGTFAPTFTLPDPTTCKGRMYRIINGSSPTNYQSIVLSRSVYLYSGYSSNQVQVATFNNGSLSDQNTGNTAIIQSDGNDWWRIGL